MVLPSRRVSYSSPEPESAADNMGCDISGGGGGIILIVGACGGCCAEAICAAAAAAAIEPGGGLPLMSGERSCCSIC